MQRPEQRAQGLTTRVAGDDVLVHDSQTDEVHCLTGELALVWRALDLGLSEPELAVSTGTDPAQLTSLLTDLELAGLLATPASLDRRAFLRRAGVVTGGTVAIGALATVVLPEAAMAGTGTPTVTALSNGCGPGSRTFTVNISVTGYSPSAGEKLSAVFTSATATPTPQTALLNQAGTGAAAAFTGTITAMAPAAAATPTAVAYTVKINSTTTNPQQIGMTTGTALC